MSLWDSTLADFRDQVASDSPTPGGGSVAAVGAALGLGLVVMALEISRRGAGERAAELEPLLGEARDLLQKLADHADRDVSVFQSYMAALALPRASAEDKQARQLAVSSTALTAAEAPLAAAQDMNVALALAEKATRLVKPGLASDVLGGADLLGGATEAALRNVDINLGALATEELRARTRDTREKIATQAIATRQRIALALGGGTTPSR